VHFFFFFFSYMYIIIIFIFIFIYIFNFWINQCYYVILGVLKSEQPNNSLYTYEGVIELNGKELPLTPNQLLLRVIKIFI